LDLNVVVVLSFTTCPNVNLIVVIYFFSHSLSHTQAQPCVEYDFTSTDSRVIADEALASA
jgi:hypothetical protein